MRKRFKHLSNRELVNVINGRYLMGLNNASYEDYTDDDYVAELFYRRDTENFKIISKWDTYEIETWDITEESQK